MLRALADAATCRGTACICSRSTSASRRPAIPTATSPISRESLLAHAALPPSRSTRCRSRTRISTPRPRTLRARRSRQSPAAAGARPRPSRPRPRRPHRLARAGRSRARRRRSRRRADRRLPGPAADDADLSGARSRAAHPLARHRRGKGGDARAAARRRSLDPGGPRQDGDRRAWSSPIAAARRRAPECPARNDRRPRWHTHERTRSRFCINTIRTLSIDAVQAANSGHPGTPMALAPLVYTLWNRVMRFDPQDPIWPNRDRFVLSNGHASMLLWSVLHLTGTQAVNADYETARAARGDARRHPPLPPARQQGARPSGISLGVGRRDHHRSARPGHRHQRRHGDRRSAGSPSRYNKPGFDIFDYDDLRGVRRRLPDGRRRLGGRVARRPSRPRQPVLDLRQQSHHDRRQHRSIAFTEDVAARFQGYGWNVLRVGDANDIERIENALHAFRADARAGRR